MTGREQKARLFSESGGRYTSPRPSSFVSRSAETKCPKATERHSPKPKRAGKHPWGLPALLGAHQQRQAGLSTAAQKMRCST